MIVTQTQVMTAFLLTLAAGLSTGLGGLLAWGVRRSNEAFLCTALGFSGGVMIYISFVEILPKAQRALAQELAPLVAQRWAIAAFFGGMLLTALVDRLLPNPQLERGKRRQKLRRAGLFTALILTLHNLPEGLATFLSSLSDPRLGVAIAVAIALHNIPEGIAVAVPIFYATGSRPRAFGLALLSGLSEPLGALLGWLLLGGRISPVGFGVLFALVAGVMVFLSLDELLPAARSDRHPHLAIYGTVGGMVTMAVSLLLLA